MIRHMIAATIACASLLGPAQSQTTDDDITFTPLGPWTMVCSKDGEKACMVGTNFKSNDEPDRVHATLAIGRAGDGYVVFIETPKLAIDRVELGLDDKFSGPRSAISCNETSCDFLIPFDAESAAKLRDAKEGLLAMSITKGEVVGLKFPLDGLKDALDKLPGSTPEPEAKPKSKPEWE